MSRSALQALAALTAGACLASAGSVAAAKPLSKAQVAAVRQAERSPELWATINVCNVPSSHPKGDKLVGVRVQMPALGFPAELYFAVRMEYWSSVQQKFVRSAVHFGPSRIGASEHAAHQGGVVFPYTPPGPSQQYTLRGFVRFEWRAGRQVLGRASRKTGHGYKNVDYSNPPGYTAGTCTITP